MLNLDQIKEKVLAVANGESITKDNCREIAAQVFPPHMFQPGNDTQLEQDTPEGMIYREIDQIVGQELEHDSAWLNTAIWLVAFWQLIKSLGGIEGQL